LKTLPDRETPRDFCFRAFRLLKFEVSGALRCHRPCSLNFACLHFLPPQFRISAFFVFFCDQKLSKPRHLPRRNDENVEKQLPPVATYLAETTKHAQKHVFTQNIGFSKNRMRLFFLLCFWPFLETFFQTVSEKMGGQNSAKRPFEPNLWVTVKCRVFSDLGPFSEKCVFRNFSDSKKSIREPPGGTPVSLYLQGFWKTKFFRFCFRFPLL
jgi:hypothetical protein